MDKRPSGNYPRGTVRRQDAVGFLWRPDRFAQTRPFEIEPFTAKHQHEETRKLRRELNVGTPLSDKPPLGRSGRGGRFKQAMREAAKTYGCQLAEQPGHVVEVVLGRGVRSAGLARGGTQSEPADALPSKDALGRFQHCLTQCAMVIRTLGHVS